MGLVNLYKMINIIWRYVFELRGGENPNRVVSAPLSQA